MPNELRYVLSADEFEKLVKGEIVQFVNKENGTVVKICLADIGWSEMLRLIQKAMRGADTRKLDRR